MENDINKKITIDVEVTTDGQQQINQYKAAFDSLRTSISGLNKPIADFSKSISSLNKDVSQMTAIIDKSVSKIMTLTQQRLSDGQTKIGTASNQALKTSLSEADKISEQAFTKALKDKNDNLGIQAETEIASYDQQAERLNALFKDKSLNQELYQKSAEQLLQQHLDSMAKIAEEYSKTGSGNLTAISGNKVNIDIQSALKGTIKQITLPFPKIQAPDKSFFSKVENTFKTLFSNVSGYYKKQNKQSGDDAVQSAKKTTDQVGVVEKTAADKKYTMSVDNTKKISDSIFSIMSASANSVRDYSILVDEKQKNAELSDTTLTAAQKQAITDKYAKKENDAKKKAFKANQKAAIAQAIINGAIAITKTEADLGPIAGTIALGAIIAQTAAKVTTIAKQQPPALAKGGYFKSDGKGAVLSGYSRTDDTNAFLRSGEGVVVSEAMQVPWARNLVSAINVGFGGRDFSVPNSTRGYAVGGIFTDGGNANRYYSAPVNDQKNLANTIAYQMINNFPPVYVDVKDINNQQNILAQTVNRVNL